MKKLFLLLLTATLSFSMTSCSDDDPKPRKEYEEPDNPQDPENPEEDNTLKLNADQGWAGYYGDYFDLGTGFFLVEINNGEIDDAGYLTSAGTAITLAVNAPMPDNGESVTLPVGTYTTDKEMTENFKILNEDLGGYSMSFVEMRNDGETTSYVDFVKDGTMTVTNNGNGTYTVTCDLNMYYFDENDNIVDDGKVQGTYTGELEVDSNVEESLYDTYPEDVNLGEMTVGMGAFYIFEKSEVSNYYLSLFAVDADLESGEFKGNGFVMTIDLYTDYTSAPDLSQLNGTFTVGEAEKYEEWTYQPGSVSELWDSEEEEYVPYWSGTYVDEIAEMESDGTKYFWYDRSSMVTGGTIEAQSDGTTVTFSLNLTTETGNTITGTYTGTPDITIPDGNILQAVAARKIKAHNDRLMRPFSKYERMARKQVKKAVLRTPVRLESAKAKH